MAYVDIELDDIDFDDLVIEVTDRLKYESKLSEHEQRLLKKLAKAIGKALSLEMLPDMASLADQMKAEFTAELREKYTENQLREMESDYSFKTKKLR